MSNREFICSLVVLLDLSPLVLPREDLGDGEPAVVAMSAPKVGGWIVQLWPKKKPSKKYKYVTSAPGPGLRACLQCERPH